MRLHVYLAMAVALPVLAGCGNDDVELDGEWDVTLTFQEYEEPTLRLPGRLTLSQTFGSLEGYGTVIGENPPDCTVDFTISGNVYDSQNIPVAIDFTSSSCDGEEFTNDVTLNLSLIDEGAVLYGHYVFNIYNDERLYISASERLH